MNEPNLIRNMLGPSTKETPRTIAVIGSSEISPTNPPTPEGLGEKSYASLTDLPIKPDIVNVFRLPKFIPAIVDEMLHLSLPNLWVQQGIINVEAAARAEAGGIHVVMDRCIIIEHRRLPS